MKKSIDRGILSGPKTGVGVGPEILFDSARNHSNALIDGAAQAFVARLRAEDSVLTRDEQIVEELAAQVASIMRETLLQAGLIDEFEASRDARLSADVGARRVRRGIHPVESLRAATTMYEIGISAIVSTYTDISAAQLLEISLALHRATMNRLAVASLSYVDALISRLHASRREERRRIARELHDLLGHNLALTLQHLDLYRHYTNEEPNAAEAKLEAAMSTLHSATRVVQHMAADMRRSVGRDGLEGTLQGYLRTHVPPAILVKLRVSGDAHMLPADVADEIYLILCEAVRNAVRHARPAELQVSLAVSDMLVEASVSDDGCGFDPTSDASQHGGGMPSMSERSKLLGGTLRLRSRRGHGTTVTVRCPPSGGVR